MFLEVISAGAAGVLTGDLSRLPAAIPEARDSTFRLGGDLLVNRLGFGAMRLTGEGIWGWPTDRENAKKVLRRAVELGVNFIDTVENMAAAKLQLTPDDWKRIEELARTS
jgi:diketogulonate reductase-like aldo/keto reductase